MRSSVRASAGRGTRADGAGTGQRLTAQQGQSDDLVGAMNAGNAGADSDEDDE
jgi:hypothetical protein